MEYINILKSNTIDKIAIEIPLLEKSIIKFKLKPKGGDLKIGNI